MNSEIKPVSIKTAEQRLDGFGNFIVNVGSQTVAHTNRANALLIATKAEAAELRAALEALQKENAELKEDLEAYQSTNKQLDKASIDLWLKNDELSKESAAQAKRIAELESELVEWNEFKKIRDMQMQALRKQMS